MRTEGVRSGSVTGTACPAADVVARGRHLAFRLEPASAQGYKGPGSCPIRPPGRLTIQSSASPRRPDGAAYRGAAASRRAEDRRTAVMMISVSPAPVPTRKSAMMPTMWGAASHNRSLPMAIVPLVPTAVPALMV